MRRAPAEPRVGFRDLEAGTLPEGRRSGRTVLKHAFLRCAETFGVNAGLRRLQRSRLLVLCYHGVIRARCEADPLFAEYMVDADEFERQLLLVRRHYQPISAERLLAGLDGEEPLPERAVLVTFDDGYLNNLTNAAPILERHAIPALISLATGYIGTRRMLWPQELVLRILTWQRPLLPMPAGLPDRLLPGSPGARRAAAEAALVQAKRIPDEECEAYLERLREEPLAITPDEESWTFLDWDGVRELHRRGFSIAAHSVNHPILTRISEARLERELEASKGEIERELGAPCPWIVYPNGGPEDFSPLVVRVARQVGFRAGFVLTQGFNPRQPDRLAIDRVDIPGRQPICIFQSRVSGLFTLLRHRRLVQRRLP